MSGVGTESRHQEKKDTNRLFLEGSKTSVNVWNIVLVPESRGNLIFDDKRPNKVDIWYWPNYNNIDIFITQRRWSLLILDRKRSNPRVLIIQQNHRKSSIFTHSRYPEGWSGPPWNVTLVQNLVHDAVHTNTRSSVVLSVRWTGHSNFFRVKTGRHVGL